MGRRSTDADLIVAVVLTGAAALLPVGAAFAKPASAGATSAPIVHAPASGVAEADAVQKPLSAGDLAGVAGAVIAAVGLVIGYLQWRHPKRLARLRLK